MQLLCEFLVPLFGYVLVLPYSITTLRLEHAWLLIPGLLFYHGLYHTSPAKKYYLRI